VFKCGHGNGIGANFCGARTCATCGTQLSPATKFFPECAQSTKSPQARFFSLDTYTPARLARKIVTGTAVDGERKRRTVVLANFDGAMNRGQCDAMLARASAQPTTRDCSLQRR
jgi:hypothetical protein